MEGDQEPPRPHGQQQRGPAGHDASEASRTDKEMVARSEQESSSPGSSTAMGQVSRQAREPICRSRLRPGLTITGQVHSHEAGLRSSWEISPRVGVRSKGVHGQPRAWLQRNGRPGLLQHSPGTQESSWDRRCGRGARVKLVSWFKPAELCPCFAAASSLGPLQPKRAHDLPQRPPRALAPAAQRGLSRSPRIPWLNAA